MFILPKQTVQNESAFKAPPEGRLHFIRMDFGENTADFPDLYPTEMPHGLVSAYPEYGDLLAKLGELFSVQPPNLLLCNGSDEAIYLISNTFIEPALDSAVVSKPCFVSMPLSLRLAGARVVEIPIVFDDLSFDVAAIESALAGCPKIAMFASPENPTGALLSCETVIAWCKRFEKTLFVIDEAYIEFAFFDQSERDKLLRAACQLDNLIVLRTFSKAWAMAGLRLGVIISKAENLEWLHRVRPMFNVNSAAVWTVSKELEQHERILSSAKAVSERRRWLVMALRERNYQVVEGHHNCILFDAGLRAVALASYLRDNGLLVRNRNAVPVINSSEDKKPSSAHLSADPLANKIRINVGTEVENKRFLELLDSFEANR